MNRSVQRGLGRSFTIWLRIARSMCGAAELSAENQWVLQRRIRRWSGVKIASGHRWRLLPGDPRFLFGWRSAPGFDLPGLIGDRRSPRLASCCCWDGAKRGNRVAQKGLANFRVGREFGFAHQFPHPLHCCWECVTFLDQFRIFSVLVDLYIDTVPVICSGSNHRGSSSSSRRPS